MITFLGTIFVFVLVFGILVFVHEFGHFFMAKLNKVRVEVFSWGYGKRLFGIKKGKTDYRVSLIPMGGYVKLSGEESFENPSKLQPYDFMAKKRWQRFLIMIMGSVMNIILAIVLFAVINMVGVTVPQYQEQTPVIGWIEPGSPADKAEFRVDDIILSINGKKTKTWNDVDLYVGTKPDRMITLKIKRDSRIMDVELETESRTRLEMGYAGFFPKTLTQVQMVYPNSPAEKGGLKANDIILSIDGKPAFYFKFVEIIQNNPGEELEFLVDRAGKELKLQITPRLEGDVGKIGIVQIPKSVLKKYGFFASFVESTKSSFNLAFRLIEFLKDLITREASAKHVGGPIEIANLSYAAFRMGFIALISWIAFISLQLGIINLFPIPVLDGGHLLVLVLEGIFRRDFSPKVKQVIMQIGFVFLIILMAVVILNDVVKRLPNGWNSLLFWK
ncbi:MAG: RIP metalloprotease RseP [Candidatus Aminicenantes bacterium]|nr:RIP metalloprotease RseP [Candidatus Aminicenantes bacterium]